MYRHSVLCVCAALLGAPSGHADVVVFNNFGPNDAYQIDAGYTVSGLHSPVGIRWDEGAGFVTRLSGTLSEVWVAGSLNAGPNSMHFDLMYDVAGAPGQSVWSVDFDSLGPFGQDNPPLHWSGSGPQLYAYQRYWFIASTADTTWCSFMYNSTDDTGLVVSRQNLEPWNVVDGALRGAFRIAIVPSICRGDFNCDGRIDFGDINPFVVALTDLAEWQREFPGCPVENADVNGDGLVNFDDINPFVSIPPYGGPCYYAK